MDEKEKINLIASHIEEIIKLLGEDTSREGLVKTPMRYAKALSYITQGYEMDAEETLKQAIFEHEGSKMVVVKDIEFYSMCEHHVLPFFGKVSIGYLPKGKMVGLSKLARIVDIYARRLQVQERFTFQIMKALNNALSPSGVIVACTAQHLCMKMRGVEKQESATSTLDFCGEFETNPQLREEFFRAINH